MEPKQEIKHSNTKVINSLQKHTHQRETTKNKTKKSSKIIQYFDATTKKLPNNTEGM